MRIRLLGTGNAFHESGRGSQSILLEDGASGATLVDVGPTAPMAMARFDVAPDRVDRLFLTHLHGDHTAGWPFLLLDLTFRSRRTAPLDVWGPRGTEESLTGLARLCYQGLLDAPPFPIRWHELEIAEARDRETGDVRFDTVPMRHHPTSLAYRFRAGGATVAVSGDTAWCDGLERLAEGVDVLLVECTTVERQSHPHVSLSELRAGVERLAARRIVLVHLTDEVAEDLARDPLPRVVAGHDGLAIEV
jgi:ribonuclease BN (tRNA processing enzyme)